MDDILISRHPSQSATCQEMVDLILSGDECVIGIELGFYYPCFVLAFPLAFPIGSC